MEKVVNPRFFYRLYTQKLELETMKPIGFKSPYVHSCLMRYIVQEWQEKIKHGFDHLEIHVEKRKGNKWVEISTLWGSFLDPWYALFQHECELELLEYHYKYCREELIDDHR